MARHIGTAGVEMSFLAKTEGTGDDPYDLDLDSGSWTCCPVA